MSRANSYNNDSFRRTDSYELKQKPTDRRDGYEFIQWRLSPKKKSQAQNIFMKAPVSFSLSPIKAAQWFHTRLSPVEKY